MTVSALLLALLARAVPGWTRRARRAWCEGQQGRLREVEPRVVWVRDGEKMPWAFWGAEHGFFELEWANRLPYLRAVATGK